MTIEHAISYFSIADIYIIAGALASGFIYLVNHIKGLNKASNVILSLVLPFIAAGTEVFINGSNQAVAKGTLVYFTSQVVYYTVKAIGAKQNEVQVLPESQF